MNAQELAEKIADALKVVSNLSFAAGNLPTTYTGKHPAFYSLNRAFHELDKAHSQLTNGGRSPVKGGAS